jgi:hypothetical protein
MMSAFIDTGDWAEMFTQVAKNEISLIEKREIPKFL